MGKMVRRIIDVNLFLFCTVDGFAKLDISITYFIKNQFIH